MRRPENIETRISRDRYEAMLLIAAETAEFRRIRRRLLRRTRRARWLDPRSVRQHILRKMKVIEGTRLSAKGQVVIPKAIRDAQGWEPGLELVVEQLDQGVLLRPRKASRAEAAAALRGCAGYRGPRRTLDEMDKAITREAQRRR